MKNLAVAFTGPSNSGKTTLIEKISNILIKENKVIIIKHDPKDKAVFDTVGKDSDKFFKTGAETVVLSPTRTTFFSHEYRDIKSVIKMVSQFDFMLVEGLKNLPLPRISIFRNKIDESYIPYSNAIAIDKSVDIDMYKIPKSISILNLNDPNSIIEWIDKNAINIKDILND